MQVSDSLSDYFEYLDELRLSGETNMFGAGAYLQDEFGLDRREARAILMEWMDKSRGKFIA
jgi:hypothetical protein